jgi:hypothetical protein
MFWSRRLSTTVNTEAVQPNNSYESEKCVFAFPTTNDPCNFWYYSHALLTALYTVATTRSVLRNWLKFDWNIPQVVDGAR